MPSLRRLERASVWYLSSHELFLTSGLLSSFGRFSRPQKLFLPDLVFFFQCVRYFLSLHEQFVTHIPQAAKDVRSSQETLVDIFDRIENFFRRLEVYSAVAPTPEMMDMMVKIMVEVLSILGIATKEIRQGRTSE